MIQEFRIERVFYYSAEGIIAWFPMALVAYFVEKGYLHIESASMMLISITVLAIVPFCVVWKLVPSPYRISTWILGLFLTNAIAMLTVAI